MVTLNKKVKKRKFNLSDNLLIKPKLLFFRGGGGGDDGGGDGGDGLGHFDK